MTEVSSINEFTNKFVRPNPASCISQNIDMEIEYGVGTRRIRVPQCELLSFIIWEENEEMGGQVVQLQGFPIYPELESKTELKNY